MAGCWPRSFICEFIDRDGVSVHKHAKEELGQCPTILTSHLVNNPYLYVRTDSRLLDTVLRVYICVICRDVFFIIILHDLLYSNPISLYIFQQSWMTSISMQFHAKNLSTGKVSLNRVFPVKEI